MIIIAFPRISFIRGKATAGELDILMRLKNFQILQLQITNITNIKKNDGNDKNRFITKQKILNRKY